MSEKRNAIRQGIISNDGCTENCIKLRINAGIKDATNAQDKAIADAYGNKFIIPLDIEMLDSAAPYDQAGLRNRLCYELTFNYYNRVHVPNFGGLSGSEDRGGGDNSIQFINFGRVDDKSFKEWRQKIGGWKGG